MSKRDAFGTNVATTVRGRSLGWILCIFSMFAGGIVAVIPWQKFPSQVRHASTVDVVSWLAVIAVAILVSCGRAVRMGLLMDSTGVTVRNYLWTYRFRWSELKSFTDGEVWVGGEQGPVWALAVATRDGRTKTATGCAQYKPELLATVRQAAEQHGVPCEVTGTPVRRGRSRLVVVVAVIALLALCCWIAPNAVN